VLIILKLKKLLQLLFETTKIFYVVTGKVYNSDSDDPLSSEGERKCCLKTVLKITINAAEVWEFSQSKMTYFEAQHTRYWPTAVSCLWCHVH
jgi:hypothetical protein